MNAMNCIVLDGCLLLELNRIELDWIALHWIGLYVCIELHDCLLDNPSPINHHFSLLPSPLHICQTCKEIWKIGIIRL